MYIYVYFLFCFDICCRTRLTTGTIVGNSRTECGNIIIIGFVYSNSFGGKTEVDMIRILALEITADGISEEFLLPLPRASTLVPARKSGIEYETMNVQEKAKDKYMNLNESDDDSSSEKSVQFISNVNTRLRPRTKAVEKVQVKSPPRKTVDAALAAKLHAVTKKRLKAITEAKEKVEKQKLMLANQLKHVKTQIRSQKSKSAKTSSAESILKSKVATSVHSLNELKRKYEAKLEDEKRLVRSKIIEAVAKAKSQFEKEHSEVPHPLSIIDQLQHISNSEQPQIDLQQRFTAHVQNNLQHQLAHQSHELQLQHINSQRSQQQQSHELELARAHSVTQQSLTLLQSKFYADQHELALMRVRVVPTPMPTPTVQQPIDDIVQKKVDEALRNILQQ